jgi:hypothetical protein
MVPVGLLILHNAWAAMLGYHLGMVLILVLDRGCLDLKSLFGSRNYYWLALMSILGLCGGLLMYLLWPYLDVPFDLGTYLSSIGLSQNHWVFFLIYFVVVNPWLEELYWRGYLGSGSTRPVINDVLFAGYHVVTLAGKVNILWLGLMLVLLIGGAWLWRIVNNRSGGLLPSVLAHLTADFSIMLAVFLKVF